MNLQKGLTELTVSLFLWIATCLTKLKYSVKIVKVEFAATRESNLWLLRVYQVREVI